MAPDYGGDSKSGARGQAFWEHPLDNKTDYH